MRLAACHSDERCPCNRNKEAQLGILIPAGAFLGCFMRPKCPVKYQLQRDASKTPTKPRPWLHGTSRDGSRRAHGAVSGSPGGHPRARPGLSASPAPAARARRSGGRSAASACGGAHGQRAPAGRTMPNRAGLDTALKMSLRRKSSKIHSSAGEERARRSGRGGGAAAEEGRRGGKEGKGWQRRLHGAPARPCRPAGRGPRGSCSAFPALGGSPGRGGAAGGAGVRLCPPAPRPQGHRVPPADPGPALPHLPSVPPGPPGTLSPPREQPLVLLALTVTDRDISSGQRAVPPVQGRQGSPKPTPPVRGLCPVTRSGESIRHCSEPAERSITGFLKRCV